MKKDIFDEYVDKVTNHFGVSREQLFTKNKERRISDARHMLYYLCKERQITGSYTKHYMGENGYDIALSSIGHGIKRIEKEIAKDPDYTIIINQLK
jgi:chromosomal replication initiation ATPase DnaA